MKSATIFDSSTGNMYDYTKIGNENPNKKYLKKKKYTTDGYHKESYATPQDEIDACLNCPYTECKHNCPIIAEIRKARKERGNEGEL